MSWLSASITLADSSLPLSKLILARLDLVGISIAWNLWGVRWLLYSFKSFTALVHEAGLATFSPECILVKKTDSV